MISPFLEEAIYRGFIGFGPTSFGYDVRLDSNFLFCPYEDIIDPKSPENNEIYKHVFHNNSFILPAHSFILGRTIELFDIPEDITALVTLKSTIARTGIFMPPTVLEAGWRGCPTLEIANVTNNPIKLYPYEGIAQVLFFQGEPCAVPYGHHGKYQDQIDVTPPRV